MKKVRFGILVVLLVCLFGSIFGLNRSQAVDVDESNYRTPIVGGSASQNVYEITRFDCNDPNGDLEHKPFGTHDDILMDINLVSGNDLGQPVYSSGSGTVVSINPSWGLVQIEDSVMGNYYGHMVKIYVSNNQSVSKGQLIGLIGNLGVSRGAHLHWETYPKSGNSFEPRDIQGVEETTREGKGCTSNPQDGYIWGQSLSGYSECADPWNQNYAYVKLFDSRDCLGNSLTITDNNLHNLSGEGFDDRVRSIYMKGHSVLMGPNSSDTDSLNYCWNVDMWNTDQDFYFNSSGHNSGIRIGWDSRFTNGSNMVSWIQVFNNTNCGGNGNNLNSSNVPMVSSISYPGTGGSNGQQGNSAVDFYDGTNNSSTQYGWSDPTSGWVNVPNYMNNVISSVNPDSGWSALVAKDDDGGGTHKCFVSSYSDLSGAYWDDGSPMTDTISSVIIYNDSTCGGAYFGTRPGDMVTFWLESGYWDVNWGVHDPWQGDLPNGVQDKVSAIGVTSGWSVLLYEDTSYGGGQACYTSSMYDLHNNVLSNGGSANDHPKSAKVFHDTNCNGWTPSYTIPGPNANLVQNSSFETISEGVVTNWLTSGEPIEFNTNSAGNDQTNSLHFFASLDALHAFSSSINVLSGHTYTWSQYLKTGDGSGEFGFYVDEYNSSGTWISGQWKGNVTSGNTSSMPTFSYTPSSSSVYSIVLQYYTVANTSFDAYVDSVGFVDTASPTPTPTITPSATITDTPQPTSTFTATPTLTPTTVYSNANLVSNGGFENLDGNSWAVDWTKDQSTVSIDANAQGNDQIHSLHFTNNAVDAHAVSSQFAILPTDTYVWSTYVKTGAGTGEFGFYIDEYDSGHNWISGQWMGDVVAGSFQTWAMFYYNASSSSVAYVDLQLFTVGGTTFEVFADSVQFQSVSAPTATPPPSNTPTPTVTFTPSPTPPITNLVVNGGFESLTSGWANNWTTDQGSVTVDTTTQGNEGTNTLHFAPNSVLAHALSQAFAVNPAYAYTWNFYLKATSGTGEFGFYVDEYDSSQTWISGQWLNAVYGETNGTGNFAYVPSSGAVAYASLQYYMNANTTFDAYVDSVLVYQSGLAPTPTPTLTPTSTFTPTETFTPTPTLTPTDTPVPPTNLVANSGFESLTSGWANNWTSSAGTVTVDTSSNGNEGTNSLHLAPDTVNTHAESDLFAVNPSLSYTWTFYAKTTSGSGEFGFYVDEYDSGNNWISGQWIDAVSTSSDGGHQYNYTPSSGSVASASLQFYMVANTSFDAYVDSVSVTQN